jgi:hypothetical protein
MKFLFPLLLITLVSCKADKKKMTYEEFKEEEALKKYFEDEVITPADSLAVFYTDCQISKDDVKQREDGKNIVFQYYLRGADYRNSSDENFYQNIHFQIPNVLGQDSFSTNNPAAFNTTFDWGCYCDMPEKSETKDNKGQIVLKRINDSVWHVALDIENKVDKTKKVINKNFVHYKIKPKTDESDTLNLYDHIGRKTGHWITEDIFKTENGIYKENYFTGYILYFRYFNDKKILSYIYKVKSNSRLKEIEFDEYGQPK